MTFEERSSLVLALARTLYINGQSTAQTLAAAERLGDTFGLRVRCPPSALIGQNGWIEEGRVSGSS
jgi:hypothetical protein